MEVIDFRDTRHTTHDGDTIVKTYLGSELMWKMTTRLVGVYSRDEVDLEGLENIEVGGLVYFDGYINIQVVNFRDPAKYIEINDQFIEVQDGEIYKFHRNITFNTTRFNKAQAEQLLGITIDDPDQLGMKIPDSVDIKYWY